MILVKYKDLKFLISGDVDSEVLIASLSDIETLKETVESIDDTTKTEDMEVIARMRAGVLKDLQAERVIGFPFDINNAEHYALECDIDYKVLELHGNTGNQHNTKEETLDAGFSGRCLSREKSAWVKAAQNSEHRKLGEWMRAQLNKAAKEQGFE